ncbi:hypothetical protein [Zoogloea sp.]|uniref:hypothetical protein n=1 Tax=Zoogloea sp. TaxID=49181 RepID=UPI00141603E8|nr:MAG: hypothetical protein F9K15_21690 [Zoogloea sp.]
MILSTIKKYINLIFKKKDQNLQIIEKDKENFKILITKDISLKILTSELTKKLNENDLYKITIKVWGKGENDESIVFLDSVKKIMHKENINETIKKIHIILDEKKEYYNISDIYLTELLFIKVNRIKPKPK